MLAEYTPVKVAATFICIVDTTSTEVPACYCSGPTFTTANVMLANTLDLQDDTTYKAVHLPLSLLIPFSIHITAKGTVTESTLDILDTTVTDGAFWALCILAHNKACDEELRRCTTEGLGKIGSRLILPRLPNSQSWGHPANCKRSAVGDDNDDEAKPAIDALVSHLLEITDLSACSVAPPATVATSPGCTDNLDLDEDALSSLTIPRKLGTHVPDLLPKDIPLNDKLRDRAKLANLGWDRTAESLHLPMLTENGKWVYCCPDRAGINQAMANMFANILKRSPSLLTSSIAKSTYRTMTLSCTPSTQRATLRPTRCSPSSSLARARSDSATSTSSQIPSHSQRNASPSHTTGKPKNSWAKPERT
jgi:hypothetical protein